MVFVALSFGAKWLQRHHTLLFQSHSAELPLDDLVKMYEGAFAENFHWPQPKLEEETSEEGIFWWRFIPKRHWAALTFLGGMFCIHSSADVFCFFKFK